MCHGVGKGGCGFIRSNFSVIEIKMFVSLSSFFLIVQLLCGSSSINYFRYGHYVLVGWLSGTREPVLGHKKSEIVALVVNDCLVNFKFLT